MKRKCYFKNHVIEYEFKLQSKIETGDGDF